MLPLRRRFLTGAALVFALGLTVCGTDAAPPAKKTQAKTPATTTTKAPLLNSNGPAVSRLSNEAWANAPLTPAQPSEIDQLINRELEKAKIAPAALTTDEQFVRRVTLDLTGHLPLPADVVDFVADKDSQKRSKLIDKLLAADEFSRHWGRYWRDVIAAKLVDRIDMVLAPSFEAWMTTELKGNPKWDQIAKAMLTADGEALFNEPGKNGQAFFLASRHGPDAANDRAAETSRVFLGIQIRCAQCHDHPFDQWKQVQFHELAAYFARLGEKRLRPGGVGTPYTGEALVSKPQGEHEMSVKNDPHKMFTVNPRFLDGKGPASNISDRERRVALANAIVDKNNYWFAGAFVNRMWGELMGQAFYQPVDDMGPGKDVVFADVLVRMSGSFRATNYDIKGLFRTILNTQAYQRQIRLGESSDQHLHFASSYPKPLNADALWESLSTTLGIPAAPQDKARPAGIYGQQGGMEGEVKRLFSFDPSLKSDEIEGNIAQALLLMNNTSLNQQMQAKGNNVLARILSSYPKDDDALETLYLRTLARKPTDRERDKCRNYIKKVGNRTEAFEDLMWALLNSTEYQSRR